MGSHSQQLFNLKFLSPAEILPYSRKERYNISKKSIPRHFELKDIFRKIYSRDSLHDGLGVLQAAPVLGGLGHSHGGLQKDLHGRLGHVVVGVELLAVLLAHLLDDGARVGVEQVDEALQDVEMESRGDELAVGPPFLTCNPPIRLHAFLPPNYRFHGAV